MATEVTKGVEQISVGKKTAVVVKASLLASTYMCLTHRTSPIGVSSPHVANALCCYALIHLSGVR